MPSNIVRTDVLDRAGMNTLLESVFQIVENNYLRKTAYTTAIAELTARVEALETANTILDNYTFNVDNTTHNLTLNVPDTAYGTLASELEISDEDNHLYLTTATDVLDDDEKAVSKYEFALEGDDLVVRI